ncbi:hypothetical protein EVAR_40047_1 [Eumeta japonica]|uniref:PiggyBac transposable element-derived protein domain-containing protein n=1 Tax=Eumeta variegata TaxID=151549 RepID=A0A4C1W9D7_EUMVA|nr:hypothetical protein EVAR_40047_1 [Eumeta japonica]
MVRKFRVPAHTTYRGLGAERFGSNTAISSSFEIIVASNLASSVVNHVSGVTSTIQTLQTSQIRTKTVPDFCQPRNQAQVDSKRMVSTDVEEQETDTGELLIELKVDEFRKLRETSDIENVIEIVPTGDIQHNITSQMEVQRNVPCDEDLPSDVAISIKLMERVIDVEQEKLLSDRWISIDESLTLFKGRLSFAQYIKPKTAGMSSFELCGSRTSENKNAIGYFCDVCDERAEARRGRVKSRGQRNEQAKTKSRLCIQNIRLTLPLLVAPTLTLIVWQNSWLGKLRQ